MDGIRGRREELATAGGPAHQRRQGADDGAHPGVVDASPLHPGVEPGVERNVRCSQARGGGADHGPEQRGPCYARGDGEAGSVHGGDGPADEGAGAGACHLCVKGDFLDLVERIGGCGAEGGAERGREQHGHRGRQGREGDAGHGCEDDEGGEARLCELAVYLHELGRRRGVDGAEGRARRGAWGARGAGGAPGPLCIVEEEGGEGRAGEGKHGTASLPRRRREPRFTRSLKKNSRPCAGQGSALTLPTMPGTHLLPPNLLKLFAPRPPLPYVRPIDRDIDRIRKKEVSGVADILARLKEANTDSLFNADAAEAMEEGEEPVFTHAEETKRQIRREERKAKRTEEYKIAKDTCSSPSPPRSPLPRH